MKCRYAESGIKTGVLDFIPGGAWRVPADWPGGVRHVGDVILVCCFRTERGKACPDTAVLVGTVRGSVPSGLNSRGIEYRRGGASTDRLVVAVKSLLGAVGAERRGRVIRSCVCPVNRSCREELRGQAEAVRETV